jgi:hypothetical protein
MSDDNEAATEMDYIDLKTYHQPEAQHPKPAAIHKLAGRLPGLCSDSDVISQRSETSRWGQARTSLDVRGSSAQGAGVGDAGLTAARPPLPHASRN